MINQNHQYFQLANGLYPRILRGMAGQGMMTQDEFNWLMNQNNVGNEFTNFVQCCISQVPALNGEAHMEKLLVENLINPLLNDLRSGRRGMCYAPGGGGFYGGGMGYRPMMGGGPGPMRYGGGGFMGNNASSGWYTGNRMQPGGFMRPGNPMFNGAPNRPPQKPKEEKPKEPPKPVIKWTEPGLLPECNLQQDNPNGTSFSVRKFIGFDNALVTEAFVIDDRPIYKSDAEAIAAYQNLFDDSKSRKFLTVCYRQLKTIKVDRQAFHTLIKAVAAAVGRISEDDVAQRIKAVISVSADHPSGAVNALSNLIVDEFNEHIRCGELTDAATAHRDWQITANNLQGIHDMLTGNLDKQTRETLHQIKNFDDALKNIVSKVINLVVSNGTAQRILDPASDKTIMDIYGRAIPPVWRNESKGTWEYTENFFTKYLASKKVMSDGSKPDSALVAEQALVSKIGVTDKNFAVIQVPRIITWCNCPSSDIVTWGSDGKSTPSVFGAEDIKCDTVFFLNRAIIRINKSKLTSYAACPRKIVCEVDEGSIRLDYGITSDGGLWTGCLRYKY